MRGGAVGARRGDPVSPRPREVASALLHAGCSKISDFRWRARGGRLRCLRRATARRRPAGRGLSRAAVPRPARGRGWGGVRLLCGRGAVLCGVGLKGAAGSNPPGRRSREPAERESASRSPDPSVGRCGETQRNARTVLPDKHRSGLCLQRATARWRLARRGLSRQAESEERSEGPASLPSGTTAVAARQPATAGSPDRLPEPGAVEPAGAFWMLLSRAVFVADPDQ